MNYIHKPIFIFLLVFTLGSVAGMAQSFYRDNPGKWVVDDGDVLSPAYENTLSNLCQREFDSTSNQIVIYTTDYLYGVPIEEYANTIFNKWKIGSKEKNNGILFMVAVHERRMRIEVGYGLEPYLTDLETKEILDKDVQPYFKKGDFENGILKGTEKIIYAIRNSYEPSPPSWFASNKLMVKNILCLIICAAIAVFCSRTTLVDIFTVNLFSTWIIFMIFLGRAKASQIEYFMIGSYVGSLGISLILYFVKKPARPIRIFWKTGGGSSGGGGGGGGGSWGGGGGGGGFSGGGGSSGGGGASGSW